MMINSTIINFWVANSTTGVVYLVKQISARAKSLKLNEEEILWAFQ